MEEELLTKATKVISEKENKLADKELIDYLNSNYSFESRRELSFVLHYIQTGIAYRAYQKVYGEHIAMGSASVLANRILRKAKFNVVDFLNLTGNGLESMMEALQTLKSTDPKEYLKYMTKLHGLDVQKTELSGEIKLPIINIVTKKEEDE